MGDVGYPLTPHVLIPYYKSASDVKEKNYNFLHSSTRICVERAFGQWKKTWRIFAGILNFPNIAELDNIMHAGAILHNMLIQRGVRLLPDNLTDVPIETSTLRPQNEQNGTPLVEDSYVVAARRGLAIRSEITATLTITSRTIVNK